MRSGLLPAPALLALALLAVSPGFGQEAAESILPNGGFAEGAPKATKIPGWTEVDGLTTFFETVAGRGRVLRIDTDVLLSEADARWEEMALPAAERPPAKPKGPTTPPKYDTVGGTTGAKIYSDYIRVEPGMRYLLRADVKSDAPTVKIFVKGYAEFQGGFRKFYQCYKNVEHPEPGWHTVERTFHPTLRSPKVTHIRVMPYAYGPPGEAWIDNVVVTRLGKETVPGAAGAKSLLPDGDFEREGAWAAEGPAARTVRGAKEACGRVDRGGTLTSARVAVEADRAYRLRARVLPAGAVLAVRVEYLLRFSGKWVALDGIEETVPPGGDGWIDVELPFHPTKQTPQATHVAVVFTGVSGTGSAFVDDVAIEPADDE